MKPAPSKKLPHLAAAKIARSPPTKEELEGVFEELRGTSDRAAGVLAAAHLEVEIEGLLSEHFVSMDEGDAHMLFGPQGFLSSAMAKVRLAHAMGLLGKCTKDACATIFDVRNMLAHAPRSVGFSTNAIKNKCDKLNIFEVYKEHGFKAVDTVEVFTAKDKFIAAVYCIIIEIGRLGMKDILRKFEKLDAAIKEIQNLAKERPIDKAKVIALLDRAREPEKPKPLLP